MIAHVMDIGANYWSLWNFHQISAKNSTELLPGISDSGSTGSIAELAINVRPSFIWSYKDGGYLGLIVGFANDGIAGVPGVLRVTVESEDGKAFEERLPGPRLSTAGQDPAGPVCAAARHEMEGTEAQSGDRGEGHALSSALGLPPEAE